MYSICQSSEFYCCVTPSSCSYRIEHVPSTTHRWTALHQNQNICQSSNRKKNIVCCQSGTLEKETFNPVINMKNPTANASPEGKKKHQKKHSSLGRESLSTFQIYLRPLFKEIIKNEMLNVIIGLDFTKMAVWETLIHGEVAVTVQSNKGNGTIDVSEGCIPHCKYARLTLLSC